MSYKNDIKNKVALLKQDDIDFIHNLHQLLRVEYSKAIDEARITGQSLQSITYEFLEAIEESLSSKEDETLESITHIMLDILYNKANKHIHQSHTLVSFAQNEFQETVEREKSQLLELIETFKLYAKEKSFSSFESNIHKKENLVLLWLKNITTKLNYKHKEEDATIKTKEDMQR